MTGQSIGQLRLHEMLSLDVPKPFVQSTVSRGMRRTIEEPDARLEQYPLRYMPDDTIVEHLKFALRNEPLDMGVLAATFRAMAKEDMENWAKAEPTGALSRRAWFLYEELTGTKLDLPDTGTVAYVDALDPELHVVVADGERFRRHKVTNNLLGAPGMYLTVRRTSKIAARMAENLDQVAKAYTDKVPAETLMRAVQYLYTKETKSSFEIEHEKPAPEKVRRFIEALTHGDSFELDDVDGLVALQNAIVDPKYAAKDVRGFQNFVGETLGSYREKVHFVCPKPEDVKPMMDDWLKMTARLKAGADPVAAAAIIAFTFVFIHPFEDGNGRIHRFLIHHVLSSRRYTPEGIIFPVSAAILRNMKEYDATLESFSKPTLAHVDFKMTPNHEVDVRNDTSHLYRYFDATRLVEFLYDKLAETIATDLVEEVHFVEKFDRAYKALTDVIDMPNKRASLFVRLCMQNDGKLPKKKREQFAELSDEEIAKLEGAIREALEEYANEEPSSAFEP